MRNDSDLLRDYAENGSTEAFAELVDRHLALVYRSALRQLNSDTHRAEDVAQMVFFALARQARTLTRHTNLTAWLYTTTHRTTCRVIRTEMRRRKREQDWATEVDSSTNAAPWTHVAPLLDEALRSLGARDREAVLLRFFANRSFAEIGVSLAVAEDAARMRVNRALERLRDQFVARGVPVSSAALGAALTADVALGVPADLARTVTATAGHLTPATGAASLFYLMAGSKFVTSAALIAALAIGFSTQQWASARLAADRLDEAQAEVKSLGERIAFAEARARPKPRPRAVASAPSTPITPTDAHFAAERAKGDQFLAAHPEIRAALEQSSRAKFRGRYLALCRDLELTPSQIDALESLAITRTGIPWGTAGTLWLGEDLGVEAYYDRLRAILGEEKFLRFRAYNLGTAEDLVQKLGAQLGYSEEPLSPAAGSAVRDLLVAASSSSSGIDWDAVMVRAKPLLTERQLAALADVAAVAQYSFERRRAAQRR